MKIIIGMGLFFFPLSMFAIGSWGGETYPHFPFYTGSYNPIDTTQVPCYMSSSGSTASGSSGSTSGTGYNLCNRYGFLTGVNLESSSLYADYQFPWFNIYNTANFGFNQGFIATFFDSRFTELKVITLARGARIFLRIVSLNNTKSLEMRICPDEAQEYLPKCRIVNSSGVLLDVIYNTFPTYNDMNNISGGYSKVVSLPPDTGGSYPFYFPMIFTFQVSWSSATSCGFGSAYKNLFLNTFTLFYPDNKAKFNAVQLVKQLPNYSTSCYPYYGTIQGSNTFVPNKERLAILSPSSDSQSGREFMNVFVDRWVNYDLPLFFGATPGLAVDAEQIYTWDTTGSGRDVWNTYSGGALPYFDNPIPQCSFTDSIGGALSCTIQWGGYYVKGFINSGIDVLNRVIDFFIAGFKGIIWYPFSLLSDWFTENIHPYGMTDCNQSGSVVSGTGELSFLQKYVNVVALVMPFAPPEGTTICTLSGPYTVNYRDQSSVVDILIVLSMILPLLFLGLAL